MIEINLLPDEQKNKTSAIKGAPLSDKKKYLLYALPIGLCILIFLQIYLASAYLIGKAQLSGLNKKWKALEAKRQTLDSFNREYTAFTQDAQLIRQLLEAKISWSAKLNILSLKLPSGIWFTDITITSKDFTLQGSVISLEKEEINLINKFIDNLKKDPLFFKDFSRLELVSVNKRPTAGFEIADFSLLGVFKTK